MDMLKHFVCDMLYRLTVIQMVALMFVVGLLGGCTALSSANHKIVQQSQQKSAQSVTHLSGDPDQFAWWIVAFSRDWQEHPPWHIDVYIAHQIFKPILEAHGQSIKLWRFHRRSGNDTTGHKFSFIFYASHDIAGQIFQNVNSETKVQNLLEKGIIEQVSIPGLEESRQLLVADLSDKNWTPEIQHAWPEFAMGASKSWLLLVDQLASKYSDSGSDDTSLDHKISLYKKVNDELDQMWEQQGNHAYLHHLNALFGYKELYVYERKLRRF